MPKPSEHAADEGPAEEGERGVHRLGVQGHQRC